MVLRTPNCVYHSVGESRRALGARNDVRNVIEFRHGTRALPWDRDRLVQTVVVVIDGLSLSEHFLAARSEGFAVLLGDETTPDLGIWGPNPPAETEAPEGYVAVLTCGCTVYGCGGSYARITFERDVVVWSDFHNEGTDEPVDTGPFVFNRKQYEQVCRLCPVSNGSGGRGGCPRSIGSAGTACQGYHAYGNKLGAWEDTWPSGSTSSLLWSPWSESTS